MSQQYSLRWNNHQPNFISMFTTLLNTKTLVDVTLAAEGQHLQAHKVVLSACSTYFQALFVDNPSRHPIVILKDVTFADLRTMVDFMYYGEVNVTEEQLPQVLDTAKLLKIKGLTEMPDSTSLTRQNTSSEFQSPGESMESVRPSASPSSSPCRKRRRRKSSSGSTNLGTLVHNESKNEDFGQNSSEVVRADTIMLSTLPQQRRREYEERLDVIPQPGETHNLNMEPMSMDTNPVGLVQGGQWSMLEHTYPRYPNAACIGVSGLQPDPGMYINNMMNSHTDHEINNYGQNLGVTGPSPGPSCAAESQNSHLMVVQGQPRRRRTTNPQAAENFQKALEAVRTGGIGFCKAAKLFGVNNRTLWLEYKKKGYPNNRPSIKSRIKREHSSPPLEMKDEIPQHDQQMALICPPHPVPVGFIDPRPLDFQVQVNNPGLNVNYQMQ
ncbi:zinc finger and BTB domain-containing protein 24-like isoform X1 [Leptidea sinapis]|uniref:zinc finger and BTB domain-containing protein 24-like isoform X1 n=1 Tax=Leptidea sinapis TaxID=189913 RepID=UPI002139C4F3|nr:zinc finger and BTB domain-containing protein 24-like isoform X1 [Leptidea sinapis]XP_050683075.1 zinc finger and BTB domain-containing protein 24-like isoform X1 [Leptidea sinapis]